MTWVYLSLNRFYFSVPYALCIEKIEITEMMIKKVKRNFYLPTPDSFEIVNPNLNSPKVKWFIQWYFCEAKSRSEVLEELDISKVEYERAF